MSEADLRGFHARLAPLEHILADAAPAVCEPAAYARLVPFGLAGHLGTGISWSDAISVEAVVFGGQRWRPARNLADQRGAVAGFLIAARNVDGELVDIVAWHPETNRVATLVGAIGTLGLASTIAFRIDPPPVHETIAEWLHADRDGVFIVDDRAAASELDGVTVAVRDIEAATRLRSRLARFAGHPNIIVPRRAA